MKNTRTMLVLSIFALAAILLSACQPATTPVVTEPPATAAPTEVPVVETGPVTLTISGLVDHELQLTDADLQGMEVVTLTLEHPKNGPTEYTGVRLNDLLTQAGVQAGATSLTLTASDGFTSDVDLAAAQTCADCLIAFDPTSAGVYNAAMPGQSSKMWVKTLISIEVK
jgi:hypothetical protein